MSWALWPLPNPHQEKTHHFLQLTSQKKTFQAQKKKKKVGRRGPSKFTTHDHQIRGTKLELKIKPLYLMQVQFWCCTLCGNNSGDQRPEPLSHSWILRSNRLMNTCCAPLGSISITSVSHKNRFDFLHFVGASSVSSPEM